MALTTTSINEDNRLKDKTPEFRVMLDSEGKGYLARVKPKEEPLKEVKEEPVKDKTRRRK